MILTEDRPQGDYLINEYDHDCVIINHQRYQHNIIVTAKQLISPWSASSIANLTEKDLAPFITLQPEIILLGSGPTFAKPAEHWLAWFAEHQLPVEFMTTPAACRTYMALLSENRRVAAALIVA